MPAAKTTDPASLARFPRHGRLVQGAALAAVFSALGGLSACFGATDYGSRERYPEPVTSEVTLGAALALASAQLSAFSSPAPGAPGPLVEPPEADLDHLVLVFTHELDALTLAPDMFGVLRGDGRRVVPVRVFLAPADESDENRSVTLLGRFGSPENPPVAVHVLGPLFAETGESLQGLDATIVGPEQADRPVLLERLEPSERRCPGAVQVLRTHWSDALREVGAEDLPGIRLRLASGEHRQPADFDDQARRTGDEAAPKTEVDTRVDTPSPGRGDDNVLDLCLDFDAAVLAVDFDAGLFRDPHGHPTAAASVAL